MKRDLRLKFTTTVFALIALVSMTACTVASLPASIPETGNASPDPTPTAPPTDDESAEMEIEIVEDGDTASDDQPDAAQRTDDFSNQDLDDTVTDAQILTDDDRSDSENSSRGNESDVVHTPPVRLQIDSIDVDAAFEYVGVNENGDMDVPQEWENVAWYEPGTIPGEQGNAVVAGHYDSDTGPAIFYKLNELEPGDHVRIRSEEGAVLVFEVTEVETVHVDDADTSKIFGKTENRNLNLITCEGIWDRSAGMYDERLIVYTTLVSD